MGNYKSVSISCYHVGKFPSVLISVVVIAVVLERDSVLRVASHNLGTVACLVYSVQLLSGDMVSQVPGVWSCHDSLGFSPQQECCNRRGSLRLETSSWPPHTDLSQRGMELSRLSGLIQKAHDSHLVARCSLLGLMAKCFLAEHLGCPGRAVNDGCLLLHLFACCFLTWVHGVGENKFLFSLCDRFLLYLH